MFISIAAILILFCNDLKFEHCVIYWNLSLLRSFACFLFWNLNVNGGDLWTRIAVYVGIVFCICLLILFCEVDFECNFRFSGYDFNFVEFVEQLDLNLNFFDFITLLCNLFIFGHFMGKKNLRWIVL